MKRFIEIFKEILHNKRKKAILSLILWFLFFIGVFILIGGRNAIPEQYRYANSDQKEQPKLSDSPLDNLKNMDNFEFTYSINIKENNISSTYIIKGIYYNNQYYLELDNKQYIIKDNVVYYVDDINKQLQRVNNTDPNSIFSRLDIRILTKESLHTFMSSSEENYSTSYKDGSKVIDYTYKNYENKTIKLTASLNQNIINSVIIDFTNYFDSKLYQLFNVEVTYQNINNISEYKRDYDTYKFIEEGE